MSVEKVVVPDFGDVQEIAVVEVYISPGDSVEVETPLIALESEKAVMDIPSPLAGVVTEVLVEENDTVKSGDVIAMVEVAGAGEAADESVTRVDEPAAEEEQVPQDDSEKKEESAETDAAAEPAIPAEEPEPPVESAKTTYHATPSVRAYARELGVELGQLAATGPKGRILKEDVQLLVKQALQKGPSGPAAQMPGIPEPVPLEDFSVYGEIEEVALSRIKKISGPHLQRSWLTIPHVTHFDEADVTELEEFRKQINIEGEEGASRISALVFIIKAVVAALELHPLFNASLNSEAGTIIQKKYYHIGIAVDTPSGLVVPVIKDADKKGIRAIAAELAHLSQQAREGKLAIGDMQGASFTISSLGGIGGTGFTPIVNSPQVAILGLSRNYMKPVWEESKERFMPRLTLPFSLSYDHRAVDGADAARFCRTLSKAIEDLRRALL